jgi:hypothetical protein
MAGSSRKSVQRARRGPGLSAGLVALLLALSLGTAGCFLPVLGLIPSVISLAHEIYTSNNNPEIDAATKNAEAEQPTQHDDGPNTNAPGAQLTAGNMCQMMALSHPNMVLVELRKNAAGAPEYRELHLTNSADEAHWTPVMGNDTGADGWLPAQNFLKMDFHPPLTAAIPDAGSNYLAYAPTAIDPNDSLQAAALQSRLASEVGTFQWGGQVFEYTVARTPPCLASSSEQSVADRQTYSRP